MFNKSCRWLESNPGPLVSEATALPTAPQPLPWSLFLLFVENNNNVPLADFKMPLLLAVNLLPMTGIEPESSGIGSDHSANCAGYLWTVDSALSQNGAVQKEWFLISGSHQISRLMNPDRNFTKHSESPPNQVPSPTGSPIPPMPMNPTDMGRSNAMHFFNQGKVLVNFSSYNFLDKRICWQI